MPLFDYPVKVEETANDDFNIVDSKGYVVLKLNWMSDADHLITQKKRGEHIANLLNLWNEEKIGMIAPKQEKIKSLR